jgi:hypothetical protein
MNIIKTTLILAISLWLNINCTGQIIQQSGYIYSEIGGMISAMPGDSGNHYMTPNVTQLTTWENALTNLLLDDYQTASDSVNQLGYELVNFTDTTFQPTRTYYILRAASTNQWGTYVYYPDYCRPVVIQSPHAKKDANTGHQGIHVFKKTDALFYMVSGTHRCNSSSLSSCTGTTTSCSSTSQAYPVSDLAHNTLSIFQKTTEVLLNQFNNTYFIQLHGFTKKTTDPYLILSNGTQVTPSLDYLSIFKDKLFEADTSLTFKIAHIDLNWTRLRGFWNTQGRLINGSSDACTAYATSSQGRFFHVEQERLKLRADVTGWNKIAYAVSNTFACVMTAVEEIQPKEILKLYPNPTYNTVTIESKTYNIEYEDIRIFNLLGKEITGSVHVNYENAHRVKIDLSAVPSGMYIVQIKNNTVKVLKH